MTTHSTPSTNLWEQVLVALREDLPRSSFESWVQETRLTAFDGQAATITARNAYARDWLTERVKTNCERLLTHLTGSPVSVRFVVGYEDESGEQDVETTAGSEPDGSITAEVVDTTRYQAEVHPERVVVLPGYALRLLQHGDLTPKQMSLWLGFRQAVYAAQRSNRGKGVVKNISHRQVCEFAMMSRASYWREMRGKTDLAGGLVEKLDTGTMGDANCYRVYMSPCLTRRDYAIIKKILMTETPETASQEEAAERALSVLNSLAERQPADYLEGTEASAAAVCPRSLVELARDVTGWKGDLPRDLADAAERLTDRILGAYGSVVITHYFLKRVVPTLGLSHAQAWAIILLRDKAWYDYESRTQQDFAFIPGGLSTLAGWVGASLRSVELWMNAPGFSTFVERILLEPADLPAGWQRDRAGVDVFWVRQDDPLPEECEKVSLSRRKNETGFAKKRDSVSEKVRLLRRKNETGFAKKRDSVSEKVRLLRRKNETLLKASIKPQRNPYQPQESPSAPAETREPFKSGRAGSQAFWDFDFLCQQNNVLKKRALLQKFAGLEGGIKKLSRGFVSWLLYVYAEGRGLNDGVSLAVSRLLSEAHPGAGGDFDRLAALPPCHLKALFEADFAGTLDPDSGLEANIYATRLGIRETAWKRDLYRRLFG